MLWYALAALAAFVAIWFFVVVPAEKRHHERKLAIIRERLEKRRAADAGKKDDANIDRSKDSDSAEFGPG